MNSGRISANDVASAKSTRHGAPSRGDARCSPARCPGASRPAGASPPPPGPAPAAKRDQVVDRQRLRHARQAHGHRRPPPRSTPVSAAPPPAAELGRNFITPFDREDIHYLATALDDICDYIFASAKKINFYKVNPNDQGIQKMADLIEQASEQIKNAVFELRNMRNMRAITDALVKVNSIENQADDIFDLSIDRLFETEPDAKEVIKKRKFTR